MKSGLVICSGCNKDFKVYIHKTEDKDWYVDKSLDSCKAHTRDVKKNTIHKNKRY